MAKTRTAQQNHDWWLEQARRAEEEAGRRKGSSRDEWLARAASYRDEAKKHLSSPASGEAQTV